MNWWEQLPAGLVWATGGGSVLGDPGLHVRPEDVGGSLCGRYVPKPTHATADSLACGSCARILQARHGLRVQTRMDRFTGRYAA